MLEKNKLIKCEKLLGKRKKKRKELMG